MLGYLTGSTCGDACWHAVENICRCSCMGTNHGILTVGGVRPARTSRIGGEMFELAAILTQEPEECYAHACTRHSVEVERIYAARFPDIDCFAYGEYRPRGVLPVQDRKLSATQNAWAEVLAVPSAIRLLWARPAGSEYARRVDRPAYR